MCDTPIARITHICNGLLYAWWLVYLGDRAGGREGGGFGGGGVGGESG